MHKRSAVPYARNMGEGSDSPLYEFSSVYSANGYTRGVPVLWSVKKRPALRVATHSIGPLGNGLENDRRLLMAGNVCRYSCTCNSFRDRSNGRK